MRGVLEETPEVKCETCGETLKPLFTSMYCPNSHLVELEVAGYRIDSGAIVPFGWEWSGPKYTIYLDDIVERYALIVVSDKTLIYETECDTVDEVNARLKELREIGYQLPDVKKGNS